MATLFTILGLLLLGVCLIVAYAYLIIINRENEMPGIEDVETLQEKN